MDPSHKGKHEMSKRSAQELMTTSDPNDRRQIDWQTAAARASDPDSTSRCRIPIIAMQRLIPGEKLRFTNRAKDKDDTTIELGGSTWSIPYGAQQTFGPFREGRMNLIIQGIGGIRSDRPPSSTEIEIEIAPIVGIEGGWIIDDGQEVIWEWDGSQIWRIGISRRGEQAGRIAQ
jgi:hypothetical protein